MTYHGYSGGENTGYSYSSYRYSFSSNRINRGCWSETLWDYSDRSWLLFSCWTKRSFKARAGSGHLGITLGIAFLIFRILKIEPDRRLYLFILTVPILPDLIDKPVGEILLANSI